MSYSPVAGTRAVPLWETFASMHFFVPDVPAAATLEALGYPPPRAAHKARRQANLVRNRIRAALAGLGVEEPDALILDWAVLTANDTYQQLLAGVVDLFEGDEEFRRERLEASAWVLRSQLSDDAVVTPEQVACAVRYLLAELLLVVDAAGIVGEEVSVFCCWGTGGRSCYHQPMPFVERFFAGHMAVGPATRQGFALVTMDSP